MATPITSVPGIGKATAFALSQHGFRSAEDLAAADGEVLAATPGFGVNRAARVIKSAQKLIGAPVASPISSTVAEAAETGEPPAKKAKDKATKKSKAGKKQKKTAKQKKKGKGKKKAGKK